MDLPLKESYSVYSFSYCHDEELEMLATLRLGVKFSFNSKAIENDYYSLVIKKSLSSFYLTFLMLFHCQDLIVFNSFTDLLILERARVSEHVSGGRGIGREPLSRLPAECRAPRGAGSHDP